MPRLYQPKALIDGFKLGAQWGELYLVAIPKKNLKNGVIVKYKETRRLFTSDSPAIEERPFKDKFGRGYYTLVYFEWCRKDQVDNLQSR
jgi:hypothetical protein